MIAAALWWILAAVGGAWAQEVPSARVEEEAYEQEGPARPLALSASVQATYGRGEDAGQGGAGHDVRLALPLRVAPRLLVEGTSASTGGADFELRVGVRGYLDAPWGEQGAMSLSASAGARAALGGEAGGAGALGVAYDTPLRGRLVGRVGLEVVSADVLGLRAGVGLVLPPHRSSTLIRQVTVYQPLPTAPEPEAQPIVDAVWVPEPICDWMPPDEAAALLAQVLRGEAIGAEPAAEPAPEPAATAVAVAVEGDVGQALAAAAVEQGGLPFWAPDAVEGVLVIMAHPGDAVAIDGAPVEVDSAGLAMVRREEGPVAITVSSGGQRQELKAALVVSHTVWVRARDPEPSAVYFAYNDTRLDRAALAIVQQVAGNAAAWSFVLQGGYSPEGTLEQNRQLAIDRARGVSRALQAAGVEPDRIVFLDPPPPDPNRPPEQQRHCLIIPVAPAGEGPL